MKKYIFLFFFLIFAVAPISAQKRKTLVKPVTKKPLGKQPASNQTAAPVTEISDKDWNTLTDALNKEDWTQAAMLSALALEKLKTENDKQQIGQLRYFYVYAMEGKVAEGKASYTELEKILRDFIGREFIMPKRMILSDCREKVNYICAAKDGDEEILRVTAADKVATIHAFEYVKLSEKFDVQNNNGKSASLAAILESVEPYSGKSDLKIARLTFAAGLATILPN